MAIALPALHELTIGLDLLLVGPGRKKCQDLGLTEDLTDRRRHLTGVENAKEIELRIDGQSDRAILCVDLEGKGSRVESNSGPFGTGLCLNKDRNIERKGLASLILLEGSMKAPGVLLLLDVLYRYD